MLWGQGWICTIFLRKKIRWLLKNIWKSKSSIYPVTGQLQWIGESGCWEFAQPHSMAVGVWRTWQVIKLPGNLSQGLKPSRDFSWYSKLKIYIYASSLPGGLKFRWNLFPSAYICPSCAMTTGFCSSDISIFPFSPFSSPSHQALGCTHLILNPPHTQTPLTAPLLLHGVWKAYSNSFFLWLQAAFSSWNTDFS